MLLDSISEYCSNFVLITTKRPFNIFGPCLLFTFRLMASNAKTRRGVEAVDRISNLPTNLIDLILEYLPTRDAARTSILSEPWRNIWAMHPRLYLDENFFAQLLASQKFSRLDDEQTKFIEVSETISNILLAHNGPILDFLLYIPEDLPFHQSKVMGLWIKNVSNKGVKELKLLNVSLYACTVPSHLFSCSQLTHLTLSNCILNPPLGFEGFCNLIRVQLLLVNINADMSFGTQLKELVMELCTGIEHLGSQFKCGNNLLMLNIDESEGIDWQWFECTQKLQDLRLRMNGMPSSSEEVITLDKLVGNLPRITSLFLDGLFLKVIFNILQVTEIFNTYYK